MTDLRQALHRIDDVPAPDLWSEASQRQPGPLPPTGPQHRVLAMVLALVVAVAGVAVAVRALDHHERIHVLGGNFSTHRQVLFRFPQGHGWITRAAPGVADVVPVSWASTIPFASRDVAASTSSLINPPSATLSRLGPDQVVMVVAVGNYVGSSAPVVQPIRPTPLRSILVPLSMAQVERQWEGAPPNREVLKMEVSGAVDGMVVVADVYFGTYHPRGSLVTKAQEELDSLTVASVAG